MSNTNTIQTTLEQLEMVRGPERLSIFSAAMKDLGVRDPELRRELWLSIKSGKEYLQGFPVSDWLPVMLD